jgi:hypothetical protein
MDNTFKWSVAVGLLADDADGVALDGNLDIAAAQAGQTNGDNETNVSDRSVEKSLTASRPKTSIKSLQPAGNETSRFFRLMNGFMAC